MGLPLWKVVCWVSVVASGPWWWNALMSPLAADRPGSRRHANKNITASTSTSDTTSEEKPSIVYGTEELMKPKAHGTCVSRLPTKLRWGCDLDTADRVCCFNRHWAENAGYWVNTEFNTVSKQHQGTITFLDTVTGKPLFIAPKGRSMQDWRDESAAHGWPSFRDEEVVWENVRILPDGETVSVDGTHLGHNLPDGNGNRYCINLVSIAGPVDA
eukprot:TRINITY_DN87242_c0_g1_i1.p1 TRINITY_DN87242_c0_g1~~TRINITY_DN87242_c0_g1_i1.p1  ORF type:complete len:214 (+),score=13.88 TRINITY_DN87242_c0_g1_i1:69-710(+)